MLTRVISIGVGSQSGGHVAFGISMIGELAGERHQCHGRLRKIEILRMRPAYVGLPVEV